MSYRVTWLSVDGAGEYPERFDTVNAARAFADEKQEASNAYVDVCGYRNPWGYGYTVRHLATGGIRYRTIPGRGRVTEVPHG